MLDALQAELTRALESEAWARASGRRRGGLLFRAICEGLAPYSPAYARLLRDLRISSRRAAMTSAATVRAIPINHLITRL